MDHCVKLGKSIKEDLFNQFSTHLAHCSSKLSPHHLMLLLFQTINSRVNAPSKYIDSILKYSPGRRRHDIDINAPCNNKTKYPNFLGKTPLMAACQMFNFQAVNSMLNHKRIKLGAVDAQGRNCLFYALRNDSEEQCFQIIRAIVSKDQSLANSTNHEGTSILIKAIQKQSLRLVNLLLSNQADPNFKCKQTGNTALHKALLYESTNPQKKKDTILLLLSFKADPSIQNKSQKSCYDLAKEIPESNWFLQMEKQSQQTQEPIVCHLEMNSVTKEDQNSIQENILSEVYSLSDSSNEEQFTSQRLSSQIDNLCKEREKYHIESWKDIQYIYEQLRKIGQYLSLEIDIIGSYSTGLWTSSSDIDIVFTNIESNYIIIEEMLSIIHQILLKRTKELGIKEMYINKNMTGNSFPNIKIDLDQRLGYRKIDITIFQKKNNGQKYVRYIHDRLMYNPYIKPVFFAMQKLLRSFNLNNPAKNGIKTYAIFLMILICAQRFSCKSSGQLFMNTIYFYAHCFVYEDKDGVPKINIYDPLNQYNNVGGRKTDVGRLHQMFKAADYGLRLATGRNILDYLCQLKTIFHVC